MSTTTCHFANSAEASTRNPEVVGRSLPHPLLQESGSGRALPAALAVAIATRCLVPVLLRCFSPAEERIVDIAEELLSCTYIVLALLFFSHRVQHSKRGSSSPPASP